MHKKFQQNRTIKGAKGTDHKFLHSKCAKEKDHKLMPIVFFAQDNQKKIICIKSAKEKQKELIMHLWSKLNKVLSQHKAVKALVHQVCERVNRSLLSVQRHASLKDITVHLVTITEPLNICQPLCPAVKIVPAIKLAELENLSCRNLSSKFKNQALAMLQ